MFAFLRILDILSDPGAILLTLFCIGTLLLWTRRQRAARSLITAAALLALVLSTLPWDTWLITPLENRFPAVRSLPDDIAGIISLGGVVDQYMTAARGQLSLNGSIERLTELVALARQYPRAKLAFTGGSGWIFSQERKEAEAARLFLMQMGLDVKRVIFEDQSRNTYENAVATKALVKPKPGEKWVLVTSARHMPRAVGSFRKAGWPVIPYPVDYITDGQNRFSVGFTLTDIGGFAGGIHEWKGLLTYWVLGRTDQLYPGPR